METAIRYYGILSELASLEKESVRLDSGMIADEFKKELIGRYPTFSEVPIVIFQNQKLCAEKSELIPGVEIDCMPPFSGG